MPGPASRVISPATAGNPAKLDPIRRTEACNQAKLRTGCSCSNSVRSRTFNMFALPSMKVHLANATVLTQLSYRVVHKDTSIRPSPRAHPRKPGLNRSRAAKTRRSRALNLRHVLRSSLIYRYDLMHEPWVKSKIRYFLSSCRDD